MRYEYLQGMSQDGRMLWLRGDVDEVIKMGGHVIHFVHVASGRELGMDARATLNRAFEVHNIGYDGEGNRPRAQEIRSMSVGDVVLVYEYENAEPSPYLCMPEGWQPVTHPHAVSELRGIAKRQAYGTVRTADLLHQTVTATAPEEAR